MHVSQGAKKRESEPDQYVWSLSLVLDGEEVVTLCDPSGGTVCTANGRPYRIAARANAARGTITLINEATRQQPFKKWSLVGPSDTVSTCSPSPCESSPLKPSLFAEVRLP